MSSEFDMYFQQFLDRDQEPFDINEYCNTGDFMIDPALEAQTLDHPAADAGNELLGPDTSVDVLEPNQPVVLSESNQSESTIHPMHHQQQHQQQHQQHHQEVHREVQRELSSAPPAATGPPKPPYKCTEENCRSKAQYKTPSQLMQHVRNKHQQPLLCTEPGCTHKRPFGKQADLDRHVRTKHEATRPHICPDESCPAHVDGFKRKDKLLKHLREDHPQVQCTQTHCSAIVADIQQQLHMEQAHGHLECALGHCASSPPSNFTKLQLKRHLMAHHKVNRYSVEAATWRFQESDSATIGSEDLLKASRNSRWEECSVCEIINGME